MKCGVAESIGQPQLTQQELDKRIGDVASIVFENARDYFAGIEPLRPRWISASELVERMRPFLVMN